MSRKCFVADKQRMSGNRVSHSNRKNRRAFLPNMQTFSIISEALGQKVRLRISANGMRSIEHNQGLDTYLLSRSPSSLPKEMRLVRKEIIRRMSAKDPSSQAVN